MWGQDLMTLLNHCMSQDHPHACGDKNLSATNATITEGSSPRVWGQAVTIAAVPIAAGIIPTRVGTRLIEGEKHPRPRDHPHACGDKTLRYTACGQNRGSSPRVWGQAESNNTLFCQDRIIPTRVGTRS